MKDRIFTMFWPKANLNAVAIINIKSLLAHGRRVQLFTYEDVINVPEGTLIRQGEDIIYREEMEVWAERPELLQAIFKYNFLLKEGGIIMDPDFVCISDHFPQDDFYWIKNDKGRISSSIISLPKGHEIARMLVHYAEDPRLCTPFRDNFLDRRMRLSQGGFYWDDAIPYMDIEMIGDDFLHNVIYHLGYGYKIKPKQDIFPLTFGTWNLLFELQGIELDNPMFVDFWAIYCRPDILKRYSIQDVLQKQGIIPKLIKGYL